MHYNMNKLEKAKVNNFDYFDFLKFLYKIVARAPGCIDGGNQRSRIAKLELALNIVLKTILFFHLVVPKL